MVLEQIVGFMLNLIINIIDTLGYGGIILLMALQSTATPLPSELIMPFAGFLVASGRFNLYLVSLAAGFGSVLGALFSYFVGALVKGPLMRKYGKFVFVSAHDLDNTEKFFAKYGDKAIFFAQFVPVARHLIFFPAGAARMRLGVFITYTFAGSVIWSFILAYAGLKLGENWDKVYATTKNYSYIFAAIFVLAGIYYVWRHVRKL